jgi:CubicO group peptidase (beta-lactamase class C family)
MLKKCCISVVCTLSCALAFAHNGSIAYAYPLGKITVDGDFSDWPKNSVKYPIGLDASPTKPKSAADFSGFFQLGYRTDNQSLYLAFTITDDDYVIDTSKNVKWDSQDGLELSFDARHLLAGSGVASFMYSKTLHNINNAPYDPFSSTANWNIMEIAMKQTGNTRYYEWRVQLGNELAVGKTIGFDFHAFDKDKDGSITWSAWGKGTEKYTNPNSLGDIVFLPANTKFATVSGKLNWDKPAAIPFPKAVRLKASEQLWLAAEVDSMGNYSATVPVGKYEISFPDKYVTLKDQLYEISKPAPVTINATAGQKLSVPAIVISSALAPDLLPEKGIMLSDFQPEQVDHFIETYMAYYDIPGISLALVKDGKLLYHKTYGVRNAKTGEKVTDSTLFEAASVTKPVFSIAVQKLVERGVLSLDTPLYKYLPYKDIEYDDRYKLITARHVLTHRTGFPNWRWMNPDGKLDLKFTPGTAFNYSGEGFEYLKLVVQKVTGKNVEQVLQEEIIEPIGLYHTFFSKNDSLQRVVSNGHYNMQPTPKELPEQPGMAYSMHTEAKIFTRFMIYLLEQKGLKASTYDTIFSKHSEYDFSDAPYLPKVPTYMGMSFEIRETPYGKSFGHGGNNGDFKCHFEVYKDLKMGYAIFTNSNTSDKLLENIPKFLIDGK